MIDVVYITNSYTHALERTHAHTQTVTHILRYIPNMYGYM